MKLFVLVLALTSMPSQPEPTGLQRRIGLEFKDIPAEKLFEILGEVSEQRFVVSPEVAKLKVTLRFRQVPVQLVLDAIAAQLELRYRREGDAVIVEQGSATDELASLRARVAELEARLAECSDRGRE